MHAKDHKKITKYTLQNYREGLSLDFLKKLKEIEFENESDNEEELVQGTVDEDGFTFERAKNWHFYRSEKEEAENELLKPFKGFFNVTYHPSSRNIMNTHTSKFVDLMKSHQNGKNIDWGDFFNILGRLIHHVQDMSTPSHVMPIFHGPAFFKDFEWKNDTYENFSQNHIVSYLADVEENHFEKASNSINPTNLPNGFISIYDQAAQRTLNFLKSDASDIKDSNGPKPFVATSTLFWQPYDKQLDPNKGKQNRGFGKYGPKEESFGEDFTATIEGVAYNIKFYMYEHIYTALISNAISDTLLCLKYADECYTRKLQV